ncbi:PREDICTED: uncharacterized protein LOC107064733 [Polistes dominula]|uniref:Uncharacterized protein LOC107064733 n=1 Tax=Polistes dominula TaxID=743375 RepID=A0ABM1HZ42_POLDO|nr:PREDICTED: uncharacterized protein LOC107064733 [Polistes dominula]
MKKLLILGFFVTVTLAIPTSDTLINRDLDCLERENELFSCIFVKAATTLDRASRSSDIQLLDGIVFVRDKPMERSAKSLKTELDVMNELPKDSTERALKLVSMIYESAMSFMKSHSLKLSIPEEFNSRALSEARGKIKKVILPLIAAVGVKIFALVPILFGGLGLLVLKALVIGKIALILAGILFFQKMFGSGSTVSNIFGKSPSFGNNWYEPATQGWPSAVSGGQQQGYYRRSFDDTQGNIDAHSLAYSAHEPITNAA